jgi:hypothetical protein
MKDKFSSNFFLLLVILFVSCGKSDIQKIENNDVIKDVEIIRFNDLNNSQKEKLDFCCYYYPRNWRDGIEFNKKEAYFVKAKIENILLAKLSVSNGFSEKELLSNNDFSLYGKYNNRWGFVSIDGDTIIETEKFEGHRTLDVFRNKNIDEVIIGPLPKLPKKMYILIVDSKYYPNITPEFNIK